MAPLAPLLLALRLVAAFGGPSPTGACLAEDPVTQARIRTCFDPLDRLRLSAGATIQPGGPGFALAAELRLRNDRASRGDPSRLWLREQTWLSTTWRPGAAQRLELLTWRGRFIRHVEEGYLLVPTTEPLRLPFPFDVGIEASGPELRGTFAPGHLERLRVGSLGLLLDVARNRDGRVRLAFGPMATATRLDGGPLGAAAWWLVPLTGAQLAARFERDDGRAHVELRGELSRQLSAGLPSAWGGAAQARAEWTPLAVRDLPVSLFGQVQVERDPGRLLTWGSTVGLALGIGG